MESNNGEDSLAVDGADTLHGGAGSDVLRGNSGADQLYGEDGDDNLRGDAGNDLLDGGAGNDGAAYRFDEMGLATGVTFDASAIGTASALDFADGRGGIDHLVSIEFGILTGSQFDDIIIGSQGGDQIVGFIGNDQIYGGAGDDFNLDGDVGNDLIDGGIGNDTLSGGADNDTIDRRRRRRQPHRRFGQRLDLGRRRERHGQLLRHGVISLARSSKGSSRISRPALPSTAGATATR